jgi:hypothetical protein
MATSSNKRVTPIPPNPTSLKKNYIPQYPDGPVVPKRHPTHHVYSSFLPLPESFLGFFRIS